MKTGLLFQVMNKLDTVSVSIFLSSIEKIIIKLAIILSRIHKRTYAIFDAKKNEAKSQTRTSKIQTFSLTRQTLPSITNN